MVDHIEIELKAAIKATSREEHLSVRRQMRIDLDTHWILSLNVKGYLQEGMGSARSLAPVRTLLRRDLE